MVPAPGTVEAFQTYLKLGAPPDPMPARRKAALIRSRASHVGVQVGKRREEIDHAQDSGFRRSPPGRAAGPLRLGPLLSDGGSSVSSCCWPRRACLRTPSSKSTRKGKEIILQREAIVTQQDSSFVVYKHFDLKERRVTVVR